MNEKGSNYTEAFNELQKIVEKMENADISVDELTEIIQRASCLISVCKNKLGQTEDNINKILAEM